MSFLTHHLWSQCHLKHRQYYSVNSKLNCEIKLKTEDLDNSLQSRSKSPKKPSPKGIKQPYCESPRPGFTRKKNYSIYRTCSGLYLG